ncbi:ABC transporter ATP-binding protein [Nonomuraea africana]|uniref:ABC-2 type transport system ATP-binding protein n=1 Tax=Nonomuraea africana TaxID=46171 RepID=A0ABR9KNX3_9ACTN|nr:ATP-binding cassette domain-containing protein [Nonomuraea africana]MBE1563735.1 ABC-2 type transport system ATP-binding protein [Nonomuraea africana]
MIIRAAGLTKEFRRPRRKEGRFGGLRTLLTREYTTTRAVGGVDLALEEGELVGFLGPNGAGKSTTIKMLTGILVPTSGTVEVAGLVPWRQRERNARQIGVVFGQRSQLWWDLPLIDSFRLVGKIYEVPDPLLRKNLDLFVDLLDLGSFLDTPVRSLSLGQRMRGDLAAAMIYEPRILYLDEPTVGLDVVAKQRIRSFIAELNRDKGVTVVLTTHDMDDVEELCRRVVIIDKGRTLYDGEIKALKDAYVTHRELVLHLASAAGPMEREVRREGDRVWLRFDPAEISASKLIREVTERYDVSDLSLAEPDLEGVIREIYAVGEVA